MIHFLRYCFHLSNSIWYFLLHQISSHDKKLYLLFTFFLQSTIAKCPYQSFFFVRFAVSIWLGVPVSPHPSASVLSLQTMFFFHSKSLQEPRELVILAQVSLLSLFPFKIQHIPYSASLAIPNNLFVDTVQCWTIRCISYSYSSSILSPILYEISKQKIY